MKQKKKVFVSSWKTDNTSAGSSTSTQVKLPLESGGTYNFFVNWGDGSTDNITAWDQAEATHTYSSAGTYTVTIRRKCKGWRFNNTGDRLKLLDISSWGPVNLGNANGYFYGAENLAITATDILDLSGTTTLRNAFRAATNFNSNIGAWDVSNITDMSVMFFDTTLFNQDIGGWNVSNVLDMDSMFREAAAFNQDINGWNVSSVIDMGGMFAFAFAFNKDLSGWDVGSVTDMHDMFRASPFDQDVGPWDITSVINMVNMFNGATLSTANYDSLLTGWEAQAVQNNVSFGGGNATYSAGAPATARANLLADHTWTIVDGGPA